jgi:outer membrane protein assembly factor BamE
MYKLITYFLLMLGLSGCGIVHRPDIEQGNIITSEMVNQLHPGMSEMEVREVMGNAVLVNIFTPNRLDYVYTYQPGNGIRKEKRVTCIFVHGRLREIIRS